MLHDLKWVNKFQQSDATSAQMLFYQTPIAAAVLLYIAPRYESLYNYDTYVQDVYTITDPLRTTEEWV